MNRVDDAIIDGENIAEIESNQRGPFLIKAGSGLIPF